MQTTEYSETSLQTAALTDPVTRRDVRAFYRPFASRHPWVRDPYPVMQRAAMFMGMACGAFGTLVIGVGMAGIAHEGAPDMLEELVGWGGFAALMLGSGSVMAWFYVGMSARLASPKMHYRLSRFAAANGLSYAPGPDPATHLTPWAHRGSIRLNRVMRHAAEHPIEFANYVRRVGLPGDHNPEFGGFCAVRLATHLPHMVLHARRGPKVTMSGLPAGTQQLSLGGDFDDRFTLYCAEEYERDALYLLTPDVLAGLIDLVPGFDVEIIDDWLFLVSRRGVVALDPRAWQGLHDAVGALTDKIDRWERWRAGRLPALPRIISSTEAAAAAGPVAKRKGWLWLIVTPGELISLLAIGLVLIGGSVALSHI